MLLQSSSVDYENALSSNIYFIYYILICTV